MIIIKKIILKLIPDKIFLKWKYKKILGKKLDLNNPQTFNEKLQWLKLYNRKPEYTKMVDKYEVKEYIKEIIGEEYIIPTLGVYDKFEDIDFDKFPDKFVIKCTHDSGGLVIVKDKKKLDIQKAKEIINKSLKNNYYYVSLREWPYKNVRPRIIIEKYMEDDKDKELRDYKYFCFDGVAKLMFIASERQNMNLETCFDFFDMNFQHLDIRNGHPNAKEPPHKPQNFDLMKKLAEKISKGIPHVRVDFYEVNNKVYFGEITFFHWGGVVPFEPEHWDKKIGDLLKLPNGKRVRNEK